MGELKQKAITLNIHKRRDKEAANVKVDITLFQRKNNKICSYC